MIFYFSGTGNSQFIAKQIAAATNDEQIFINQCVKEGATCEFHSTKPLIFVAPTYAWRLPKVVEQWISTTSFTGNSNVYFVLTCGQNCGNAAFYAQRLCRKKNLHFNGLCALVMPENYLALFPTPSAAQCDVLLQQAKSNVEPLIKLILENKPFSNVSATVLDKLQSGPVNLLFYPFIVHDKGFSVSSACVSCQKCAQRCPLNNIQLNEGKPLWKGTCTHCMACIAGCPAKAIEYKNVSQGKHRHFILEDVPEK